MIEEVGKRHSCRLFGSEPSALSRREFGRGLAAILAAGVAPAVLAGGLRRGLAARCAAAAGGKALPYDRRIAYLENVTGEENGLGGKKCIGSYLNLGIHPDSSSVARVKFSRPNNNMYCGIFCSYDSNEKNFGIVIYNNTAHTMLGSQSAKTVTVGNINEAELNARNRTLTFNGSTIALPHGLSQQSEASIYLFNDNAVGNDMIKFDLNYNFKGKIYSFEYESNSERLNLIPVVKTFEGVKEGCMYDTIGNRFFRNAGTGAFTWG